MKRVAAPMRVQTLGALRRMDSRRGSARLQELTTAVRADWCGPGLRSSGGGGHGTEAPRARGLLSTRLTHRARTSRELRLAHCGGRSKLPCFFSQFLKSV